MELTCIVTGGSGFLGQHLIHRLVTSPRFKIHIVCFDIRQFQPWNKQDYTKDQIDRVASVLGDLTNAQSVQDAFQQIVQKSKTGSVDCVFHCATAAPSGMNARNQEIMHAVNVIGTDHVIQACRALKIKNLVYTSSASVVFNGQDLNNVDETIPLATSPVDYYTKTKAIAEQAVLDANDVALHTCALRPSAIFGENDPLFVPSIVNAARNGKMKFVIGNGKNMMDFTYVGNVALAHELAMAALLDESKVKGVTGQAFFITNDEPRPFWQMTGDICDAMGYGRPQRNLPFLLVYVISIMVMWIALLLSPVYKLQTEFSPSRIILVTCNRQVSCEKAKKYLGYKPETNMDDAFQKTMKYFSHLKK